MWCHCPLRGACLAEGEIRIAAPLFEPAVHVEIEELLGPQHPGQGLAHDIGRVGIERRGNDAGVELIRLLPARLHDLVEMFAERAVAFAVGLVQRARRHGGQPQPNRLALSGRHGQAIVRRRLRARSSAGFTAPVCPWTMKLLMPSLTKGVRFCAAEQPLRIGFVFGEQQRRLAIAIEIALAQVGFARPHDRGFAADGLQRWPRVVPAPRPAVAEPERRQHVDLRGFRTAIVDADLNQDVLGRFLGVFHEHVEVTVLVEDAGVDQFVLEFLAAAPAIGLHQLIIRVGRLRILVEILHVRVRRRAVEVEVILLDVLAVIALAVGQAEQPLLEDGILPVPEREREAEALLVVGDAGQAVLAPVIGARARLVVAEVIPGVAVLAVVLAHGAPLAFAEVGPPFLPGSLLLASLFQSFLFSGFFCVFHC